MLKSFAVEMFIPTLHYQLNLFKVIIGRNT